MATMVYKSDEARAKLRDILDEVTAGREVVIQRYDKPVGVIIPYELWKAFKRIEVINEAKRIKERTRAGKSNYTSGAEVMRQVKAKQAAE